MASHAVSVCNRQTRCVTEYLCVADPYADDFKRFAANVKVVTYAINDRSADVFAEKVILGIWETEMIVKTPIGHINIITPLIGRNNVYNVLAAVATGMSMSIPLKVRLSPVLATFGVVGLLCQGIVCPTHLDSLIMHGLLWCICRVLWSHTQTRSRA